jgi:hypothetical protein
LSACTTRSPWNRPTPPDHVLNQDHSRLSGDFQPRHIRGMRSSSKSGRRPGHGRHAVDRGYPLGTGIVRPMWHAAGTNGTPWGAGRRTPRDGAPPSAGHHHVSAQAELARRGCTFGLTCQDAGLGRIRRADFGGNDLEQFGRGWRVRISRRSCSIILRCSTG